MCGVGCGNDREAVEGRVVEDEVLKECDLLGRKGG